MAQTVTTIRRWSPMIEAIRNQTPICAPSCIYTSGEWKEWLTGRGTFSNSSAHVDPDLSDLTECVRYELGDGYTSAGAQVYLRPDHANVDLTHATMKISFYVEVGAGAGDISGLVMFGMNAAGTVSSNSRSLMVASSLPILKMQRFRISCSIPITDLADGEGVCWVNRLRFRLTSEAAEHGTIAINISNIAIYPNHAPLIVWTIGDDSFSANRRAVVEYAHSLGIPTCFFNADNAPASADLAACMALPSFTVCGHAWDGWKDMSAAERVTTYNEAVARQWALGASSKAVHVFASPGGSHFDNDIQTDDDFDILPVQIFRGSDALYNMSSAHGLPLMDAEWSGYGSAANVRDKLNGYVTSTINQGGLAVIGIHNSPSEDEIGWIKEHLDTLAGQVTAGTVQVIGVTDLIADPSRRNKGIVMSPFRKKTQYGGML